MLIFALQGIQAPIIVLMLFILLIVVVKIIFLIHIFRWCEPSEWLMCSRIFLKTPDIIKHLHPTASGSGCSRSATSHSECSHAEAGGEWRASWGPWAVAAAAAMSAPTTWDVLLGLLSDTPTCVHRGHEPAGGRQLALHNRGSFGLLHCSEMQKRMFMAQQLCGSTSVWWASFTATLPDGHQVSWAHFREQLHASLGTHLIHSLAYHPQTDGQTEWVNQVLEDMLCSCVMNYQDSWDKCLQLAEFSYYNSYQESLKMAPFETPNFSIWLNLSIVGTHKVLISCVNMLSKCIK
jgi:hypothetical protein